MKAFTVFPAVLCWTLLTLSFSYGQFVPATPMTDTVETEGEILQKNPYPSPAVQEVIPVHGVPSPYMQYCRSGDCHDYFGFMGPVRSEYYVRSGISLPFGNGIYGENLETGWLIQGGARVHFFTPAENRSWFFDVSLSNVWNQAASTNARVPLSIIVPNFAGNPTRVNLGEGGVPGVTIRDINRTFVNLGAGHAFYFNGNPDNGFRNFRFLIDGGGRYGSTSAQFYEIRQRTDTITGAYVGLEGNVEIPWGCCTFIGGVRGEYAYTWNDVLQAQNEADIQDINIIFSLGVKY